MHQVDTTDRMVDESTANLLGASASVTGLLYYTSSGAFAGALQLVEDVIADGGCVAIAADAQYPFFESIGSVIDASMRDSLLLITSAANRAFDQAVVEAEEWLQSRPGRRVLILDLPLTWEQDWDASVNSVIRRAEESADRGVHVVLAAHGSNALERDPGAILRCSQLWFFGRTSRPVPEATRVRLGAEGLVALDKVPRPWHIVPGRVSFVLNRGLGVTEIAHLPLRESVLQRLMERPS